MRISDWSFRRVLFRSSLDAQILNDAKPLFERGERMQLTYNVRNTHRAVGTRLSAEVTARFGMKGLADNHVQVRLRGTAGQSLGAFLCQGITPEVFGDANDYVGKRSEEHTSELQSLMRISYAVFCLKKKKKKYN